MAGGSILGFMRSDLQEKNIHLKRGIGKAPQDLELGLLLVGHQIQDDDLQWSDVLILRTRTVHDEYVFVLQSFRCRKLIRYD